MIEEIYIPLGENDTLNKQINLARSHWSKSSAYKKIRTNEIELLARGKYQFTGKVWLECIWKISNFGNDPDNVSASLKYILDGLVKAGIIKNDNLTVIQNPVVHWYEKTEIICKKPRLIREPDSVVIKISDVPIYVEA